ncbi:MAG TPA: methylated-DNA--[protein]-cysteine S-methyltransferase [Smithellaceae bacterium]|nr:methylated-DNA--[protein]-cysteine S-methyltransferase [Smithellaceae bacterium]
MFYQVIKVGKDEIGLVWDEAGKKVRVEYVYLPGDKGKMANRIVRDFPAVHKTQHSISKDIDQLIAGLYNGQKKNFDLSLLNLSKLTDFSAKVLRQTYKIPHGKVATYSGLAAKIGNPRAARAVGTALADNPFPILIPCHRVIRADGQLGQFGGGSDMKKKLLEREGIIIDPQGVVPLKHMSY